MQVKSTFAGLEYLQEANCCVPYSEKVDEVLKVALIKELMPVEWIDAENLAKSKTGEKVTTGSPH